MLREDRYSLEIHVAVYYEFEYRKMHRQYRMRENNVLKRICQVANDNRKMAIKITSQYFSLRNLMMSIPDREILFLEFAKSIIPNLFFNYVILNLFKR